MRMLKNWRTRMSQRCWISFPLTLLYILSGLGTFTQLGRTYNRDSLSNSISNCIVLSVVILLIKMRSGLSYFEKRFD